MTAPLLYADTSALTKLVIEEAESRAARRLLEPSVRVVSSAIAAVELPRAVRRAEKPRAALARAEHLLDCIHLVRLTEDLLRRAARLEPGSLRTLDAIHLATALDLSPLPELFCCYDQRLAVAARAQGLTVASPGIDEVHEP